jgi:hypothetical protein
MKKIIHCLIIALTTLISLTTTVGQTPTVAKVFSKSFNIPLTSAVVLELPGTVEIKEWDNTTFRFEITVTPPTGTNPAMLNELANVGRYNLVTTEQDGIVKIAAPNTARPVKVKGQDYKETMTFVLHAPKGVSVEIAQPGTVVVPVNR